MSCVILGRALILVVAKPLMPLRKAPESAADSTAIHELNIRPFHRRIKHFDMNAIVHYVTMNLIIFHQYLAKIWHQMVATMAEKARPRDMADEPFLSTGLDLCHLLAMRSTI